MKFKHLKTITSLLVLILTKVISKLYTEILTAEKSDLNKINSVEKYIDDINKLENRNLSEGIILDIRISTYNCKLKLEHEISTSIYRKFLEKV